MIRLGSLARETATGLDGMVTHFQIDMDGARHYVFQPRGLSPETGKPLKVLWVNIARLEKIEWVPQPPLPVEVLGTQVEDLASGFKGMAISLLLHLNGCIHIGVQPAGQLEKTNAPIDVCDFDIRRLTGEAIVDLMNQQRYVDQLQKPGPCDVERYQPGSIE